MLLFAGSLADDEVVDTVRRRGGVVVAVGPDGPAADVRVPLPSAALMDPLVRALVEPAVAELLAGELWRRTTAAELEVRQRPVREPSARLRVSDGCGSLRRQAKQEVASGGVSPPPAGSQTSPETSSPA